MDESTELLRHRAPVWSGEDDTVIFVHMHEDDLFGDEFDVEEIPARSMGEDLYKICAIPLSVHDINLGDIVKVDKDKLYRETITDSGRFGFRLAINIPSNHVHIDVKAYDRVIETLRKKKCTIELFSHAVIAVDADNLNNAKKLSEELEKMVKKDWLIAYDTVRS